jgi:hypothetical protein
MSASLKNDGSSLGREGGKAQPLATERARSIPLDMHDDRVVARIARVARAACGLSAKLYAAALGRSETSVEKDEDATHTRAPSLRDELHMPQEAFEVHVREVLLERHRRGFPLMQIKPAAQIIHASEAERFMRLTAEAADVQRALADGAPAHVVVKEATEMRDAADEVIASRLRAA